MGRCPQGLNRIHGAPVSQNRYHTSIRVGDLDTYSRCDAPPDTPRGIAEVIISIADRQEVQQAAGADEAFVYHNGIFR